MDFRTAFVALLGLSQYLTQSLDAKTAGPTTSLNDYRTMFSDLLPRIKPENREWWLHAVQTGDRLNATPYPTASKNAIVAITNKARRTTAKTAARMREVRWNNALEAALITWRNNNNASIFYDISHRFPQRIKERSLNVDLFGNHLMELPEFAEFWPYCDKWWHDTNFPGRELNIVKLRAIVQKSCFEYSRCNTTGFDNFYSCIRPENFAARQACSFANRYYGNIVKEEIESIAGVRLRIPGAFTPNRQPDAAWYYYCTSTPMRRNNDLPFKVGPRASECIDEFIPAAGLCRKLPSTTANTSSDTTEITHLVPTSQPTTRNGLRTA